MMCRKFWTRCVVPSATSLPTIVSPTTLSLKHRWPHDELTSFCRAGDTHTTIVVEGGITEIIAAMTRHTHDRSVCLSGSAALGNLAAMPHNRVRIAAEGGISALVGAMVNHRKAMAVQSRAARALALIAADRAFHASDTLFTLA